MLQVFSNYLSCYLQFGGVGYVLDLRKTESDEAVNIKDIYKLPYWQKGAKTITITLDEK